MTRYLGYIAMSLDARIADADGGLGWLDSFGGEGDFGYADFYAGIDALVMGRATFDAIAGHDWPYAGKPAFIVTSGQPGPLPDGAHAVPPDFPALRRRIESEGHDRVWIVGGGRTQRAALDAGMFDELRLFLMPVLLGGGPMVFAGGGMVGARLLAEKVWPKGVIELHYEFG